jgi:hypothetical protein
VRAAQIDLFNAFIELHYFYTREEKIDFNDTRKMKLNHLIHRIQYARGMLYTTHHAEIERTGVKSILKKLSVTQSNGPGFGVSFFLFGCQIVKSLIPPDTSLICTSLSVSVFASGAHAYAAEIA